MGVSEGVLGILRRCEVEKYSRLERRQCFNDIMVLVQGYQIPQPKPEISNLLPSTLRQRCLVRMRVVVREVLLVINISS